MNLSGGAHAAQHLTMSSHVHEPNWNRCARALLHQVFALLDMHSQVAGVLPALEVALSAPLLPLAAGGGAASRGPSVDDDTLAASGLSAAAAGILREFSTLAHMAADAAAALFREYADVVAMDDSKILPPDGTIHPLTAQVVGYIKVCGLPLVCSMAGNVLGSCTSTWRSRGGATLHTQLNLLLRPCAHVRTA